MRKLLSMICAVVIIALCLPTVSAKSFEPCFASKSIDFFVGDDYTLELYYADKDKIKWSSTNEDAVTVDEDGWLQCIGEGTAVIKAKYKKKTYKCTVNVTKMSKYERFMYYHWNDTPTTVAPTVTPTPTVTPIITPTAEDEK